MVSEAADTQKKVFLTALSLSECAKEIESLPSKHQSMTGGLRIRRFEGQFINPDVYQFRLIGVVMNGPTAEARGVIRTVDADASEVSFETKINDGYQKVLIFFFAILVFTPMMLAVQFNTPFCLGIACITAVTLAACLVGVESAKKQLDKALHENLRAKTA